jgi:hypothetical protein
LRVESQETCGLLRVPAGTCFPLEQAAIAIESPDSVHIGYKIIVSFERARELDLQITMRLRNFDAIILAKPLEELNALS